MKIIQAHNYYQQAGGEDAVVEAELELLRAQGHKVVTYYKNNSSIVGGLQLVVSSLKTLWNWQTYAQFRKLLQKEHPDIVHCHNTFPLISPSIYWACAKEKVPVVQTLHNYRLLCLNAFLFRQNRHEALSIRHEEKKGAENVKESTQSPKPKAQSLGICELCVSKTLKWTGIRYSCYRDSKAGSLVVALMLFVHKLIGTWSKKVTAYIALTEFQKQKMVEGGLPADKIWVKPNFIQTTEMELTTKHTKLSVGHKKHNDMSENDFNGLNDIEPLTDKKPYCLFVGRLSPEKGCDVLIRAWELFCKKCGTAALECGDSASLSATHRSKPIADDNQPKLLIAGDGPERSALENLFSDLCPPSSITFLGQQPKECVLSLMRDAQFLISPSVCYETFGLVVLEAGILKTPSVVGAPGAVAGLIENNETGLLFSMGDEMQLAEKIEWAFSNPERMQRMGAAARRVFDEKYSAEENAKMLINIYEQALDACC